MEEYVVFFFYQNKKFNFLYLQLHPQYVALLCSGLLEQILNKSRASELS